VTYRREETLESPPFCSSGFGPVNIGGTRVSSPSADLRGSLRVFSTKERPHSLSYW
jgi:hypothetical protein